jgi:hypothetical protein
MFGDEKKGAELTGVCPDDGIVPRLLRDLFEWVVSSRDDDVVRAVRMSCVQVLGEQVGSWGRWHGMAE